MVEQSAVVIGSRRRDLETCNASKQELLLLKKILSHVTGLPVSLACIHKAFECVSKRLSVKRLTCQ